MKQKTRQTLLQNSLLFLRQASRCAEDKVPPNRSSKVSTYSVFKQRVACREVAIVFVADADTPADFLTKFVGKEKIKRSVEYPTNASAWKA